MLMCVIVIMTIVKVLGKIKEFSFEYIAEWLCCSRVREGQLQPLLKNIMIKAEKHLGPVATTILNPASALP